MTHQKTSSDVHESWILMYYHLAAFSLSNYFINFPCVNVLLAWYPVISCLMLNRMLYLMFLLNSVAISETLNHNKICWIIYSKAWYGNSKQSTGERYSLLIRLSLSLAESTHIVIQICLSPRIQLWGKYYYASFVTMHCFSLDVGFTNIVVESTGESSVETKYRVPTVWGRWQGCHSPHVYFPLIMPPRNTGTYICN